jgi:hypothetical protein
MKQLHNQLFIQMMKNVQLMLPPNQKSIGQIVNACGISVILILAPKKLTEVAFKTYNKMSSSE